jgi:hypothetical protein
VDVLCVQLAAADKHAPVDATMRVLLVAAESCRQLPVSLQAQHCALQLHACCLVPHQAASTAAAAEKFINCMAVWLTMASPTPL